MNGKEIILYLLNLFFIIGFVIGIGYPVDIEGYAILSMGIQWLASIHAIYNKTEKYYDLMGTVGYLTMIIVSMILAKDIYTRNILVSILLGVWTLRLGYFLFGRIKRMGHDKRFEKAKEQPLLFLIFWSLQGLWIFTCLLPFLLMNHAIHHGRSFRTLDIIGLCIWVFGFTFEAIADYQKSEFKAQQNVESVLADLDAATQENAQKSYIPTNSGTLLKNTELETRETSSSSKESKSHLEQGLSDDNISSSGVKTKFMSTGLWKYSRHPNYFGEIVLWYGIFLLCIEDIIHFELYTELGISIISPVFVTILLIFVSGVKMAEDVSEKKYGNDPQYQLYKAKTSILIPWFPSKGPPSSSFFIMPTPSTSSCLLSSTDSSNSSD